MALARPLAAALSLALAAPALAAQEAPAVVPPAAPATGSAPAAAADPAAADAKARAWFTDTVLLDQDGRPRRFYGDVLQGQVVCLSFIFTNCGEACPLIMQKLKRVRAQLGDRAREVQFISLSVDPENDTPAALKAFAAKHDATGPGWTFLTGSRTDLATVHKRLGTWVEDPGLHQTGFIAGNVARRHWTKVRPDVVAEGVAEILRGLADESAAPGTAQGASLLRPAQP
jgi:cytochrome oxidase Cu insertion factor (SCO1/SenC/PrrC family)